MATLDFVTLERWSSNNRYQVEQVSFADGTVWDIRGFEPPGPTEGADILYGISGDDVIDGLDGDDVIYGLGGNDILKGSDGNDTLYGGADDDMLAGGPGDDTLLGDAGDDTYHFNLGSGQDTIYEHDDTAGNTDPIQFGEDIAKEDIAISQNGSNLQIDYGNGDIVTIQNQSDSANAVEQVETNGGYYLTNEDINTIIQDMTAFANDNGIPFSNIDDVKGNEGLMNIVANSWKST